MVSWNTLRLLGGTVAALALVPPSLAHGWGIGKQTANRSVERDIHHREMEGYAGQVRETLRNYCKVSRLPRVGEGTLLRQYHSAMRLLRAAGSYQNTTLARPDWRQQIFSADKGEQLHRLLHTTAEQIAARHHDDPHVLRTVLEQHRELHDRICSLTAPPPRPDRKPLQPADQRRELGARIDRVIGKHEAIIDGARRDPLNQAFFQHLHAAEKQVDRVENWTTARRGWVALLARVARSPYARRMLQPWATRLRAEAVHAADAELKQLLDLSQRHGKMAEPGDKGRLVFDKFEPGNAPGLLSPAIVEASLKRLDRLFHRWAELDSLAEIESLAEAPPEQAEGTGRGRVGADWLSQLAEIHQNLSAGRPDASVLGPTRQITDRLADKLEGAIERGQDRGKAIAIRQLEHYVGRNQARAIVGQAVERGSQRRDLKNRLIAAADELERVSTGSGRLTSDGNDTQAHRQFRDLLTQTPPPLTVETQRQVFKSVMKALRAITAGSSEQQTTREMINTLAALRKAGFGPTLEAHGRTLGVTMAVWRLLRRAKGGLARDAWDSPHAAGGLGLAFDLVEMFRGEAKATRAIRSRVVARIDKGITALDKGRGVTAKRSSPATETAGSGARGGTHRWIPWLPKPEQPMTVERFVDMVRTLDRYAGESTDGRVADIRDATVAEMIARIDSTMRAPAPIDMLSRDPNAVKRIERAVAAVSTLAPDDHGPPRLSDEAIDALRQRSAQKRETADFAAFGASGDNYGLLAVTRAVAPLLPPALPPEVQRHATEAFVGMVDSWIESMSSVLDRLKWARIAQTRKAEVLAFHAQDFYAKLAGVDLDRVAELIGKETLRTHDIGRRIRTAKASYEAYATAESPDRTIGTNAATASPH